MFWISSFFIGLTVFCFAAKTPLQDNPKTTKHYILYLLQTGQVKRAVQLYQKLARDEHDFSLLEQLSLTCLTQGAESQDEESRLLSMYGAKIAGTLHHIHIYQLGLQSSNPTIQLATTQLIGQIEDDRAKQLLFQAFSSPYLAVRLEAAYALAQKRDQEATGLIHALMQRLPRGYWVYFPSLFAMIGTPEATQILKNLSQDSNLTVRLAAMLAAAEFKRDDLLKTMRSAATHSHPAEQETAATALGYLKDSDSKDLLIKLSHSTEIPVQLAASRSLISLGNHIFWKHIIQHAQNKELLAIPLLADAPEGEETLRQLLTHHQPSVRFNAALALLEKRSVTCIPTLLEMLIGDTKDFGFQPSFSPGHSLMFWKVIPSAHSYAKKTNHPILSLTLSLKESILKKTLELPEKDFLSIASTLFQAKQNTLIPTIVQLIENMRTKQGIALLKQEARRIGAPLSRTYCHLALYRLNIKQPHEHFLRQWILDHQEHEMIEFHSPLSWTETNPYNISSYLLSPQETSRLLIEIFAALSEHHDKAGIDMLLGAIEKGHPKNQFVLAGLLLNAIH